MTHRQRHNVLFAQVVQRKITLIRCRRTPSLDRVATPEQSCDVLKQSTLSAAARVLRFFMGIPGGNKQEGIRQLERAIAEGDLTAAEARFYLAINLHNYDQKYQRALEVAGPLADKYPTNPLFQLIRGDLYAKLGRKEQAAECYRAAAAVPLRDRECRTHVAELVRSSLATIGADTATAGVP